MPASQNQAQSTYKKIPGAVCAPQGFLAATLPSGIKDSSNTTRHDLGLLYADSPCTTAGVFTKNKIKAAPVRVSQVHLRQQDVRAIIVNSGNANVCNGLSGMQDAKAMCQATAKALQLKQSQVLVCSTGLIGLPLPIDRIKKNIPPLAEGLRADNTRGQALATAIMTSDTRNKHSAIEFPLGSKTARIGIIAKGAGMICPNMATMLCFITTDVKIDPEALKEATAYAVEHSFNRITIDGDMSTNDTVLVMANGRAGNTEIKKTGTRFIAFRNALTHLMLEMAHAILRDGEKVTKLIELHIQGSTSHREAKKIAYAIAHSPLVKSAWNGSDPNWGRIIAAIGYANARVREECIDIYYDGRAAAKGGRASKVPYATLAKIAQKSSFRILIDLHLGNASHTLYTTDLSPEYIDFNRTEYISAHKK